MLIERCAPNRKEHDCNNPSYSIPGRFSTVLSPPVQVIETLALEDTDIISDHIAQIKELIQKEDIIEEEKSCQKTAAPTQ